ncbi:MAG: hypothetical protein M3373_12675 [Gemmatimonadota bacterium]|nr:hypothetical protein [Gemmatimonadota bacterium]
MPDSQSNLPAKPSLGRPALERVLARAAELQAHEADPAAALSEEQIVEIGKEVGLSTQHIRQALAEERTRLTIAEEPGFAGRIAGPAVASASRAIPGRSADILATLGAWMEREECLQPKRRFPDRTTWEAKRGLASSIQRGLNLGGRGYALARASEVAATVVQVDEGRVLVRLDADLGPSRASRLAGGGTAAAAGIGAGLGPLVLGSALLADPTGLFYLVGGAAAAAGALLGIGGGYAIARGHQRLVAEVRLALEQILDQLERGEASRSAFPAMLNAAEQLIRGTLTEFQTKGQWPRLRP